MSRQGVLGRRAGLHPGRRGLIVIVLTGIVLTIANPSWFGAIETRRIDSAPTSCRGPAPGAFQDDQQVGGTDGTPGHWEFGIYRDGCGGSPPTWTTIPTTMWLLSTLEQRLRSIPMDRPLCRGRLHFNAYYKFRRW